MQLDLRSCKSWLSSPNHIICWYSLYENTKTQLVAVKKFYLAYNSGPALFVFGGAVAGKRELVSRFYECHSVLVIGLS